VEHAHEGAGGDLEKAGKDGDKAAFDKLKTAAEAGEISARSFMGV
jgi:hypothetical protein